MEKQNIVFPRFDCTVPVGECAMCGRTWQLEQLHQLPEVESYARNLAQFMSGKGAKPATIKDDFLIRRYGYGFKSLFCDFCYDNLIAASSQN